MAARAVERNRKRRKKEQNENLVSTHTYATYAREREREYRIDEGGRSETEVHSIIVPSGSPSRRSRALLLCVGWRNPPPPEVEMFLTHILSFETRTGFSFRLGRRNTICRVVHPYMIFCKSNSIDACEGLWAPAANRDCFFHYPFIRNVIQLVYLM